MGELKHAVMACLRQARRPQRPQQIAQAVDAQVLDVYDVLGYLVRHGIVRRHFGQPGVLRYAPARATPVPIEPSLTPHWMRPQTHRQRPSPMADAVLAIMGDQPMRSSAVIAACADQFTREQIKGLLQRLRRQGLIKKLAGGTSNALWARVDQPPQARP